MTEFTKIENRLWPPAWTNIKIWRYSYSIVISREETNCSHFHRKQFAKVHFSLRSTLIYSFGGKKTVDICEFQGDLNQITSITRMIKYWKKWTGIFFSAESTIWTWYWANAIAFTFTHWTRFDDGVVRICIKLINGSKCIAWFLWSQSNRRNCWQKNMKYVSIWFYKGVYKTPTSILVFVNSQSERFFYFFRCEIWVAVLFKPIKSKFEDNNKKTHTIHESIRLKCDLNSILYRKICVMLHVILLQFVLKQMFWAINSMQSLNSIYE